MQLRVGEIMESMYKYSRTRHDEEEGFRKSQGRGNSVVVVNFTSR